MNRTRYGKKKEGNNNSEMEIEILERKEQSSDEHNKDSAS